MNLEMFWCPKRADKSRKKDVLLHIMCTDIPNLRSHYNRLPDYRVIGPSENRLESDPSLVHTESYCSSSDVGDSR